MTLNKLSQVKQLISEGIKNRQALTTEHLESIVKISELCTTALESGKKLLLCGNGGSAADAQHLAAELLIRLRPNLTRQTLPAIALSMDPSTITACGNDIGFTRIFERMVEAFACEGDILIGITTSGNSKNILNALSKAREMGIKTIGFLGGNGGHAINLCDLKFIAPTSNTARIQELHITVGHIVMELVENNLLEKGKLKIAK